MTRIKSEPQNHLQLYFNHQQIMFGTENVKTHRNVIFSFMQVILAHDQTHKSYCVRVVWFEWGFYALSASKAIFRARTLLYEKAKTYFCMSPICILLTSHGQVPEEVRCESMDTEVDGAQGLQPKQQCGGQLQDPRLLQRQFLTLQQPEIKSQQISEYL